SLGQTHLFALARKHTPEFCESPQQSGPCPCASQVTLSGSATRPLRTTYRSRGSACGHGTRPKHACHRLSETRGTRAYCPEMVPSRAVCIRRSKAFLPRRAPLGIALAPYWQTTSAHNGT